MRELVSVYMRAILKQLTYIYTYPRAQHYCLYYMFILWPQRWGLATEINSVAALELILWHIFEFYLAAILKNNMAAITTIPNNICWHNLITSKQIYIYKNKLFISLNAEENYKKKQVPLAVTFLSNMVPGSRKSPNY